MAFAAPYPVPTGTLFALLAVHVPTPPVLNDFIRDVKVTLHGQEPDRLIADIGREAHGTPPVKQRRHLRRQRRWDLVDRPGSPTRSVDLMDHHPRHIVGLVAPVGMSR